MRCFSRIHRWAGKYLEHNTATSQRQPTKRLIGISAIFWLSNICQRCSSDPFRKCRWYKKRYWLDTTKRLSSQTNPGFHLLKCTVLLIVEITRIVHQESMVKNLWLQNTVSRAATLIKRIGSELMGRCKIVDVTLHSWKNLLFILLNRIWCESKKWDNPRSAVM